MRKKYDVVVKIGERNDGKAVWQNVGVMMDGDRGPFLLINRSFNPAGVPVRNPQDPSVLCSLFEPKDRDGDRRPDTRTDVSDSEIPF